MSRWAVPNVDGLRISSLDVKMGRPKCRWLEIGILDVKLGHPKCGRLENQDPGCQDGPSQMSMA